MQMLKIKPLTNGWVVKVGCASIGFLDLDLMMKEIEDYIRNPAEVEVRYLKAKKNAPFSFGTLSSRLGLSTEAIIKETQAARDKATDREFYRGTVPPMMVLDDPPPRKGGEVTVGGMTAGEAMRAVYDERPPAKKKETIAEFWDRRRAEEQAALKNAGHHKVTVSIKKKDMAKAKKGAK